MSYGVTKINHGPAAGTLELVCTCSKSSGGCGVETKIIIKEPQWDEYCSGEKIQHCLGDFSKEQRETILTGYCSKCQQKLFT